MYADLISLCVILGAIVHAVVRILVPCRAGNGEMSRTLTGMYITAVFIFAVVVADTMQDRPTSSVHPATVSTSLPSPKHLVAARPSNASERSRVVLKEKYFILGMVFVCFSLLYLLSHRNEQITRMLVWVVMAARRLNPFEHDSRMDSAIVDILVDNKNDEQTRRWVLDYVLAKRGVSADTRPLTDKEMETPVPPMSAGRFSDD